MSDQDGKAGRRVLLGEITGAHGVRGEVVIRSFTDDPQSIGSYGPLFVNATNATIEVRVRRDTGKGVVAAINGVTSRTEAEKLRGTKLYADRARMPEPAAGEYYRADLAGLGAVSPEGVPIGKVIGIVNYGASDIVEIEIKGTKRTELVPLLDAYVTAIDLEAGTMTVVMPVMTGEDAGEGQA